MIDGSRPPAVVKRPFGIVRPRKRHPSHDGRIVVKKLSALDKQHRSPQTREIKTSRRAARAGTDNDHIPQVIFMVLRSNVQGNRLHYVRGVPLKASPAFSYIVSRTRAVNTASSGGSEFDSSPLILFTNASSWS